MSTCKSNSGLLRELSGDTLAANLRADFSTQARAQMAARQYCPLLANHVPLAWVEESYLCHKARCKEVVCKVNCT